MSAGPDFSPLRVVFFGTPPFAARCLAALLASRHEVVAAITRPDRPAGRGLRARQSAVKQLALDHGIKVLEPASAKGPELLTMLASLEPDLGVVAAYGRILPKAVLDSVPYGFINAHASLLPALRGAAPIERAILEGYHETGVTIMQMNERMDAGDILASRVVAIDETSDRQSLTEMLAELASEMLVDVIEQIVAGTVTRVSQDESRATYAPPLDTREAEIDWSEPAERIVRRVRAFRPYPGAYTFDCGRRLKIIDAQPAVSEKEAVPGGVLGQTAEGLLVGCGSGVVLISRIQPEGRRPMSASDYLRGRKGPPLERLDGRL